MEWKTALKLCEAAQKAERTATIHWSRAQMRAVETLNAEDIRAADRAWTACKRFATRRLRLSRRIRKEFGVSPLDYHYNGEQPAMNGES